MIAPMLLKARDVLPPSKDYLFEIKLDGQRTVAEVSSEVLLLYTRSFQDVTNKYPELMELCSCLRGKSAILDGEIVALEKGIPSFELLQQRINLRNVRMLKAAVERVPISYYAFDILELNDKPLLKTPLLERKKILQRVLRPGEFVKILPFFDSKDRIIKKALQYGYEGVVAKRLNSFYCPGQRTDYWLKQKFQSIESFVIGGWSEGERTRNFGALVIGKYREKELVYTGKVGTGFDEATTLLLLETFGNLASARCPFASDPQIKERVHWLKPKLVAEIKFKEWTKGGNLRSPVFIGLRHDLTPKDCNYRSGFNVHR